MLTAYSTDSVTPVDSTEARRIAEAYLYSAAAQARGDILAIQEFEICFTVVIEPPPSPPTPADEPPLPPAYLGSAVSLIDKETGCVSFWPSWPEEVVVRQYAELKEAGQLAVAPWPQADFPDWSS